PGAPPPPPEAPAAPETPSPPTPRPVPPPPPPPLRPILSTAPEDMNEIVGRYAISVEKHHEDHEARSQIEEYVAGNCP
ncbi:MAG: hypothetical protein ABR592_11145, partial [Nitriliruptorales bacterium]